MVPVIRETYYSSSSPSSALDEYEEDSAKVTQIMDACSVGMTEACEALYTKDGNLNEAIKMLLVVAAREDRRNAQAQLALAMELSSKVIFLKPHFS